MSCGHRTSCHASLGRRFVRVIDDAHVPRQWDRRRLQRESQPTPFATFAAAVPATTTTPAAHAAPTQNPTATGTALAPALRVSITRMLQIR